MHDATPTENLGVAVDPLMTSSLLDYAGFHRLVLRTAKYFLLNDAFRQQSELSEQGIHLTDWDGSISLLAGSGQLFNHRGRRPAAANPAARANRRGAP